MFLRFRNENIINQFYFIVFILQLSFHEIYYQCEVRVNLPPCPCSLPTLAEKSSLNYSINHTLCILDNENIIRSQSYNHNFLNVVIFHGDSYLSDCNVILKLSSFDKKKLECPGKCVPVPFIELSYSSFFSLNSSRNNMILCSLSPDHILNRNSPDSLLRGKQDKIVSLLPNLAKIYFRRLSECFEHSNQYLTVEYNKNNLELGRKRIEGLFIWIGTVNKIDVMRAQATVIQELTTANSSSRSNSKKTILASIAWLATEEIYGCRTGTTGCRARLIPPRRKGGKKLFHYNNDMPFTRIPKSSAGWNCAQRRPLRVLAHTLKLFDPTFLVLLDDDTYLNFPLFRSHLLPQLTSTTTANTPLLFGEFMDPGHVSENGFLVGGAGYFMNAMTIAYLTSHKVLAVPMESPYSSVYSQSYSLSILREVRAIEKFHSCHNISLHQLLLLGTAATTTTITTSNKFSTHPPSSINTTTTTTSTPDNNNRSSTTTTTSLHSIWGNTTRTLLLVDNTNTTTTTTTKSIYLDLRCKSENKKVNNYNIDDPPIKSSTSSEYQPSMESISFVDINIPLIDLCTKLLSGENTCHHSDHAVSRCLFYGAGIKAKGLVCNAAKYPGHFGVGLCHEVNQICDTKFHVTCHRWKPENELTFRPVRLYNDSGFYDEFSSGNDQAVSFGTFNNKTAYG